MTWNPQTRRYIDDNGNEIDPADVRQYIDDYITAEKQDIDRHSELLLLGLLTIGAFFEYLREKIVAMHGAATVIAYGGEDNVSQSAWIATGAKIHSELGYLEKFQAQVEEADRTAKAIASDIALASAADPSIPEGLESVIEERVASAIIANSVSDIEAVTKEAVKSAIADSVGSDVAETVASQITIGVIDDFSGRLEQLIWGEIGSRGRSYADAAYGTHENSVKGREGEAGAVGVKRVDSGDDAECDDCPLLATDDYVAMDEVTDIGDNSACGSRCVVEGTLMSGCFNGGLKALYSGEIVNIRTASGRWLSITPNHPVLTDRGFVFAGDVEEGDNLICERPEIEGTATLDDKQEPPARIEQILTSLGKLGVSRRMRRGFVDLHGDERFFEGDVDVISVNGILRNALPSSHLKFTQQDIFPFANLRQRALSALSVFEKSRTLQGFASCGVPSGNSLSAGSLQTLSPTQPLSIAAITDGHAAHCECASQSHSTYTRGFAKCEQTLSIDIIDNQGVNINAATNQVFPFRLSDSLAFGNCANMDIALGKPATKDVRSDAKFLRQLRKRFSGLIANDPVTEITRDRSFTRRHVYDLSTDVGWQSANGVIIANCRCWFEFSFLNVEPLEIDREIYA